MMSGGSVHITKMPISNVVIIIILYIGMVSSFGDFALSRSCSQPASNYRLNYGRKSSVLPLLSALYSGPDGKITEIEPKKELLHV